MFDTYKAVKYLEAAGVDEEVARAIVETVSNAVSEGTATKTDLVNLATKDDIADMATRSDLATLRSEMATKTDIAHLKSATIADIKDSEARLTTRFIWIGLAIVGLTSAIMGALDQILG